jgi:hypothetical protein
MGDYKFMVEGHKYNYNVTKDPKVTNALTMLNRIQFGIDQAMQKASTGARSFETVMPMRNQVQVGSGGNSNGYAYSNAVASFSMERDVSPSGQVQSFNKQIESYGDIESQGYAYGGSGAAIGGNSNSSSNYGSPPRQVGSPATYSPQSVPSLGQHTSHRQYDRADVGDVGDVDDLGDLDDLDDLEEDDLSLP